MIAPRPNRSLMENAEDTIQLLLLTLHESGGELMDSHKLCKILYFADQKHLAKYGRPLSDDRYIAMPFGPVPSKAYELINALRGKGFSSSFKDEFEKFFQLEGKYKIKGLTKPDYDFFSESEIECIRASISENKSLAFTKLTAKSNDEAWDSASLKDRDSEMDYEKIAKAGGASLDMIRYIRDSFENKLAKFE